VAHNTGTRRTAARTSWGNVLSSPASRLASFEQQLPSKLILDDSCWLLRGFFAGLEGFPSLVPRTEIKRWWLLVYSTNHSYSEVLLVGSLLGSESGKWKRFDVSLILIILTRICLHRETEKIYDFSPKSRVQLLMVFSLCDLKWLIFNSPMFK